MTSIPAQEKWKRMLPRLNEKQQRYYLALEAKTIGYGGITQIAQATGISRETITNGVREIETGNTLEGERVRRPGGGRKKLTETDRTLTDDLEALVDPKGDPQSFIKWITKSVAHIREALNAKGHTIRDASVRRLLRSRGFSLQASRKTIEGDTIHPDRDAQFQHINKKTKQFVEENQPVISIDTKKKELIGNYKNNGREWKRNGEPTKVNVYDFIDKTRGKAVPYGIYEVAVNKGFVNVGTSADTAEFAGNSLMAWWERVGKKRYKKAREIYITSDSGGSNGVRVRLWKLALQKFANLTGLIVHVSHLPPGTSKWNKIEHKMFAFISINWRSVPLTSMEVIIKLIANTKTKEGLEIEVAKDTNVYRKKIKVSDAELATVNIQRDAFHGEWNYMISPNV